jgi:hypothetical protein
MSMKNLSYKPALLILLAVALLGYACTRVEDNTRSASLLTVSNVVGIDGGEDEQGVPLLSDLCQRDPEPCGCAVFNDNAQIDFENDFLQIGPGGTGQDPTFINDIVVNRYRVDYFRPSGRNTPGVDVPFGIDGTMNIRVPINGTAQVPIIVVRHEAKKEPPLSDLIQVGPSEGVITVNSEMKFFGQDISGRTVSALGFLEIHFADFGDEGC